MQEKGTISIHTENIFPIIKKFLYSDHEIFLRELVSNAVDATQKLKSLAALGEFKGEIGDTRIKISVNKNAKTITVSDRGIGMTAEEIKKYINQIAFSGAKEFIEKYKDKDQSQQLIGQFGLGFYSAFMVAEKVRIITKSWQEGAEAAQWSCDGSTEFEISPAVKAERGTDIILHIAPDSEEFLQPYRLREILTKYCKFLPIEVALENEVINNTQPLWIKNPTELKDEDYLNFYHELYPLAEDPLFWIHLNVDYPFRLTGILFFPRVKNELVNRNKIQLYQKQVFITDEVKDIVPEFLTLLHGVIDSPDIPLNVSRSFLQADSNVKKINNYITRKVADKLQELFKADREAYQQKWEGIEVFVKFGMISDDKFAEKAAAFALLKNTQGKYFTFDEYKEHIKANQTDKNGNLIILYTNNPEKQDMYVQAAQKRSYDVLLLNGIIDSHFAGFLERKFEKVQLKRVDAETIDKLIEKTDTSTVILSEEEKKEVTELYKKISGKDTVTVSALSSDELPVSIIVPEFFRRMKEMAMVGGGMDYARQMPDQMSIVINGNHPLINKLVKAQTPEEKEKIARHTYDLALLAQNMLNGKDLTAFLNRSLEWLN
ncbi:MAG: molecular chaperone HtpG [Cytophagales bacterium]|nr:molecular chaperone HtpG [Bernardetiaceae bacterium]MDW8205239.1 molecular chaperone HtpG [Cytophagales bacterium]